MRRRATEQPAGVSLSRGPALILGTVLLAAGLYFLYRQHTFVPLSHFPSGHAAVTGKAFIGIFGVNGWTGELTAVAGGLLLIGAAHHAVAKTFSLIVGIVFAVVAIWALVNHHDALGLFGLGIWTIVGYGAAAVLLLVNTLLPRRGARTAVAEDATAGAVASDAAARRQTVRQPAGTGTPAAGRTTVGSGRVANADRPNLDGASSATTRDDARVTH